MKRMNAVAIALATMLAASAAHAAPTRDELQAPRAQDQQAPRDQDDLQAPRGQDQQAPRDQDDLQAPRGQDLQAPRGDAASPRR